MFCRIPVASKDGVRFAMVDADDYEKVLAHKWHIKKSKKDRVEYVQTEVDGKPVLLHRLIMGAQEGQLVDHRSSNGMNNCKSNLRICNYTESSRSVRKTVTRKTTSQYKGVYKSDTAQRWIAQIKVDGVKVRIGSFNLEKDAAKAYNRAAIKYFGEFAKLNDI